MTSTSFSPGQSHLLNLVGALSFIGVNDSHAIYRLRRLLLHLHTPASAELFLPIPNTVQHLEHITLIFSSPFGFGTYLPIQLVAPGVACPLRSLMVVVHGYHIPLHMDPSCLSVHCLHDLSVHGVSIFEALNFADGCPVLRRLTLANFIPSIVEYG